MNIVLIGFMGTGKSAVGRALARRLRARYVDTDWEIERAAGKSVARIFADDGEPTFRALETSLLEQLAEARTETGAVVATGGGMPLRPENAALLRRIGPVVWLTAPPTHILRRVGPSLSARPLLAAHQDDPLGRIEALLADRAPHYAAAADLTWDTSRHASPAAVAARLAEHLCLPAAPRLPVPTETA
jgi:shikimate kinase